MMSESGLLIRGGTLLTATEERRGDVRCRDGRIAEVGPDLAPEGDEVLDARGRLVFPGGIDPHVHMQLPVAGTVSADDFETGTAAGLAGGTTSIVDFVHPLRGQDYLEALAERRREAEGAAADYGLHMAITWWGDESAAWMARCVEQGVTTFKLYMAYKDAVGLDDVDLIRAMRAAGELGALVVVHAEHGDLVEHLRDRLAAEGKVAPRFHAESRPPEAEGEATGRAAFLAAYTGAPLYVVHVTCRQAVEAIARARERGQTVWGETCPHYLLLDVGELERPGIEGAAYVCAPPLRPREHQEVLWTALGDGVLQVVATDHCPFDRRQRELGRDDFRRIPGGLAGIEHRLALLWTHGVGRRRITRGQFVDLVSTRPARLFGLYPRKGSLAVGADADLVVWDPGATATLGAAAHRHRCDTSAYEGFEVRGLPSAVVARGGVRYRDGELRPAAGEGRFLRRGLVPPPA